MNQYDVSTAHRQESSVAVNKVLKNTYWLLALTLAFSAFTAMLSMNATVQISPLIFLVIAYGLLFATHKLANSPWGLATTFAFTGFMGYDIGPLMGYLMASQGGSEIVMTALGGTAFIFFGLSGWALVSRKDFSFLSGFIAAGALVLSSRDAISSRWRGLGLRAVPMFSPLACSSACSGEWTAMVPSFIVTVAVSMSCLKS